MLISIDWCFYLMMIAVAVTSTFNNIIPMNMLLNIVSSLLL